MGIASLNTSLIKKITDGGPPPLVWTIPKPEGNYYLALAIGTLGVDEQSSDITILYGNATTLANLSGSSTTRVVNCFKDSALSTPTTILNKQLVGIWFGDLFNTTSPATYFLNSCTAFNQPLILPDVITSIGMYFLYNCYAFNQPITLPRNLTIINTYFLSTCNSFNQPITIPNSVTRIEMGFLNYCRAYNQPLNLPSNIDALANSFLNDCQSYNQPLVLPSSITTIGSSFLKNCSVFNHPLILPGSITSIGVDFLNSCNSFTSQITCNTSAYPSGAGSLADNLNYAPIYTEGVPIGGTNAAGFLVALPNSSAQPYRNLRQA